MKIPPWVSLAFRISTAVFAVIITAAQGSPTYFGGNSTANAITFWLGLVVAIENVIFSCLGTGAQPSQTLLGKVA